MNKKCFIIILIWTILLPKALFANINSFCVRDIKFSFSANVEVKSSWSAYHQQNYSVSKSLWPMFKFGFASEEQKARYESKIRASEADIHPFVWKNNIALKDLKTTEYYEEEGLLKNKRYRANLFVLIENNVYLHFQIDALVAQYGECMALLNETLASLELNANCGDCILETPQLATVQIKLSSIEGTEWIRGQDGADILLRQGPGDDLFLIWPHASEKHFLSQIKNNGNLVRHYDFGRSELYDVVAHNDGFVVLISHPNKDKEGNWRYHHLYIEKYDLQKKLVWSTHLMGVDEIERVGDQRFAYWGRSSTRLAWSGEYYAAYFASYRKWPDLVTHQGDVFLTITNDGVIMHENNEFHAFNSTWDVSHSFAQELIFDSEKFYRLALGDAYPRAINLERSYPVANIDYKWNRHKATNDKFLDFPGKSGDNYVYDTQFGNAIMLDGKILFAYGTELAVNGIAASSYGKNKCNDLFLKMLDTNCQVVRSYKLTTTVNFDEDEVSIAYLGNDQLLVKYRSINPKPKGLGKPSSMEGDFEEILMVYDLKMSKTIEKTSFVYQVKSEIKQRISLSAEREPFMHDLGTKGQKILCSPLFKHQNGKVYTCKFLSNGSGLQLLEFAPNN